MDYGPSGVQNDTRVHEPCSRAVNTGSVYRSRPCPCVQALSIVQCFLPTRPVFTGAGTDCPRSRAV